MKLLESAENYLEAILMVREDKGVVIAIDIVNKLGFSKPSVSVAMKNLETNDFIARDADGFIHLTESGEEIARMIYERPMMNRFVQGFRTYERDEISLSFVAKRRFADGAEEALMVFTPDEDATLETLSRKINGDVREMRKSEHAAGGIDSIIEGFMKIPRPILAILLRIIRYLFMRHQIST